VTIKYDPRDMSRIFVRQPDGHFIEARYRNLALNRPGFAGGSNS
jgi:hypothetical protein